MKPSLTIRNATVRCLMVAAVSGAYTLTSNAQDQSYPRGPGGALLYGFQELSKRADVIARARDRSARGVFGIRIPAGTAFSVTSRNGLTLAKASKGTRIVADVEQINPANCHEEDLSDGKPFGSNFQVQLAPGEHQLTAQVVDLRSFKDASGRERRMAFVLFDQLLTPDGRKVPFLGAMSSSPSAVLPPSYDEERYKDQSHASEAQSLAVVLPWAADTGPIGIAVASLLTRHYQKDRMERRSLERATQAAMSVVVRDMRPSKFCVISTIDVTY